METQERNPCGSAIFWGCLDIAFLDEMHAHKKSNFLSVALMSVKEWHRLINDILIFKQIINLIKMTDEVKKWIMFCPWSWWLVNNNLCQTIELLTEKIYCILQFECHQTANESSNKWLINKEILKMPGQIGFYSYPAWTIPFNHSVLCCYTFHHFYLLHHFLYFLSISTLSILCFYWE